MIRLLAAVLALIPVSAAMTPAATASMIQQQCDPRENPFCDEVARLAADPRVRQAFRFIEETDDRTIRDLIMLTEIPAPPFGEERRGLAYAELLRDAGADSVFIDEEGNVIALRRGTRGERVVAISGHMDTVFPEGTDVTVRQRGDTLFAPGIGDDTRGLIVVLTLLRALHAADIRGESDILFIGTVGEEGLGDLRGVKHLFREGGPRIDVFISVDGGEDGSIVNEALGSRRYRVTYRGPGGHSWGAFGTANPANALGRAIRLFDEEAGRFTATGPRTSYNVGRIGGGTSVNSIPYEAWMEVDMRSISQPRLRELDAIFLAVVQRALSEQNEGHGEATRLRVETELVGDRPSGTTDPASPLVRRAMAVAQHYGISPVLRISSTDANVPISLGVPAITISRGGVGGGVHSLDEWWVNEDGPASIHRAMLLLLAEAGLGPAGRRQ